MLHQKFENYYQWKLVLHSETAKISANKVCLKTCKRIKLLKSKGATKIYERDINSEMHMGTQ